MRLQDALQVSLFCLEVTVEPYSMQNTTCAPPSLSLNLCLLFKPIYMYVFEIEIELKML
jgi:hypothetical protein